MMQEGADVAVVTVAEMPMEYRTGFPAPLPSRQAERARTARHLQRVEQALRGAGFTTPPPIHFATSSPSRVIVARAGETNAELILVGLTRRTRLARIFAGEVTVQVAQLSPVPVLAVPADRSWPPRRAAVAVDFSPESLEAVGFSARLLDDGATLRVVHVLPSAWRNPTRLQIREQVDLARGRLEEIALEVARAQGVAATPELLHGDPGQALVHFARAQDLDLLSLGSHGQGFVDRLLLGSTTRKVLRSATCATLVIPHGWSAESG